MLGKVRQNKECSKPIIVFLKEFRECGIGEVANPAHYPLLYHPGIRAVTQHFNVVIGLNHEPIAAAQCVSYIVLHLSKVGNNADFHSIRFESEATRIGGIMRNGKRHYRNIGDGKTSSGMEVLPALQLS